MIVWSPLKTFQWLSIIQGQNSNFVNDCHSPLCDLQARLTSQHNLTCMLPSSTSELLMAPTYAIPCPCSCCSLHLIPSTSCQPSELLFFKPQLSCHLLQEAFPALSAYRGARVLVIHCKHLYSYKLRVGNIHLLHLMYSQSCCGYSIEFLNNNE